MDEKLQKLSTILAHLGCTKESTEVGFFVFASETFVVPEGFRDIPSIYKKDNQYKKKVEQANPGLNWNKLMPGQKIVLPDYEQFKQKAYPNASFSPSARIIQFIKNHEKYRAKVYDDGFGNPTIGYGHKLQRGEQLAHLSEYAAEQLLMKDLSTAADFIKRNIKIPLKQNQFDALVSLVFNAGGGSVFRTDLFKAVDSGDMQRAARLFSNTLVGKNQGGVAKRRAEEAELFAR